MQRWVAWIRELEAQGHLKDGEGSVEVRPVQSMTL